MLARSLPVFALSLVMLAVTLTPCTASADILIGAGAEVAVPLGDDLGDHGVGFGLDAFVAYILPLPFLDIAVGADGGYTWFSEGDTDFTLDIGQILGQLRVGADLVVVKPEVFAGVGYGWLSGAGSDFVKEHGGLSWQVGASLGFSGLPLVSLGLHAAYNEIHYDDGTEPVYQWVDVGLNAQISF